MATATAAADEGAEKDVDKPSASGWDERRSAAGKHSPWILAGVISIATFMTVLDSTIVNVALPHIAGSLGTSIRQSTWVLTSFLIAQAIIIPISGFLSDVIGRKRFYMLSVALFTGASLACAFATSLPVLIFFRIIQGLAGGGLAPSEQSMLADSFPPEKRGMAFAAYAVVVVVGPILGPTAGGWMTDTFSWHWIFIINLPFGILSLVLVQAFVVEPDVLVEERKQRLAKGVNLDGIGLALVAIGLGSLTYVLAEGQTKDWFADTAIVVLSITAVVALSLLVWWELRHPDPIVPLRLLGNRQFAIVILLIFLVGIILFGTTQIIPQMFQEVYGYTALQAGLALTAGGVGLVAIMPLAGRLAGNVDPRAMIVPGFLALAFGVHHFTSLTTDATFWDLSLARLYQTFALPFVFVTVNTIAYVGMPANKTTQASAMLNVFRNIGGSVGISIAQTKLATGAAVAQANFAYGLDQLNPNFTDFIARARLMGLDEQMASGLLFQAMRKQAQFIGYLDVYHLIFVMILMVTPLCFLLRPAKAGGRPVPA